MESAGLIILAVASIALVAILSLAGSAALAATKQSRQLERVNSAASQLKIGLLSSTLERTHTDLSIRKRPPLWYDVLIARVDQESEDVKSFYLIRKDGESLPKALAGQHLLIEMPADKNRSKQCRCYTLSDHCDNGYWRISVKRNSDAPESVSRWLHDDLSKGDSVRVKGPSGSFFLQNNDQSTCCSAQRRYRDHSYAPDDERNSASASRLAVPLCAIPRRGSHALCGIVAEYRSPIPHGSHAPILKPIPRGVSGGKDAVIQQGKFTASDVVAKLKDPLNADCYLCGPEAWQSDMVAALAAAGVPESQIHFELFKESEKPAAHNPNVKQQPCSVHFRQSNKLEAFAATYPNLLGFAIKSDIPIDSGCRTGACGSCLVKLVEGKVKYTRRPQFLSNKMKSCPASASPTVTSSSMCKGSCRDYLKFRLRSRAPHFSPKH